MLSITKGSFKKWSMKTRSGAPVNRIFSPCRLRAHETLEGRAFDGTPDHMSESPCESLKRMGISTHASTAAPMRRAGSNRHALTASRAESSSEA